MNRNRIGVLLGLVFFGTVALAEERGLVPDQVFACGVPSAFWQKTYAAIPGSSLKEKSQNARTTLDAKALSEMELYEKERQLAQLGLRLWESLPETLSGMEDHPRERLLKTHRAWWKYVQQQTQFVANTSGGGSMYSLLERDVLKKEIDWRIRFYRELLDGKNAVKHELYFYGCKSGNDGEDFNH